MNVWLSGFGIVAPGLQGWQNAKSVLSGQQPWSFTEPEIPAPQFLGARERRRCSTTVRLALHIANEAIEQSPYGASDTTSVFANSTGDTHVVTRLLNTLGTEEKLVSPTDFHNSVHNAPAGYWTISSENKRPSTSISAGRHTFGAGLLKAISQMLLTQTTNLLVCYEDPFPHPLGKAYPIEFPMGVALLLTHEPVTTSEAKISNISISSDVDHEPIQPNPQFQEIIGKNPVADALPLLESVATQKNTQVKVPLRNRLELVFKVEKL